MLVIKLNVDGTLEKQDIGDGFEALQEVVGGLIDKRVIHTYSNGVRVILYLDDEGLLKDRLANMWGALFAPFVGDGVVCLGLPNGRDVGVTGEIVHLFQNELSRELRKHLHGAGLDDVIGKGEEGVEAIGRERLEVLGLHPGEPFMMFRSMDEPLVRVRPKEGEEERESEGGKKGDEDEGHDNR